MSSVKVAVRVRPFNARENGLNAKLCIAMNGPSTTIFNLDKVTTEGAEAGDNAPEKKFTFDYSFWSHDRFEMDPVTGYAKPDGPGSPYADQQQVFEVLGKEVLDNAWDGYHCCLFAYGQTGSGKSYSMVGYGPNKGIVPISCEEIFRRIESNTNKDKKYEVQVSMLEIYNEKIQDLLLDPKKRTAQGLEVRESKQLGIYVEGLLKKPVGSYSSIEAVVDEGTKNRTVGETNMNKTSSRAHTVLIIEFVQVESFGGKEGRKISMINLVDLAGSEKAEQTGATGDRLKEGCAINKSLSALGNVISALADKATGKMKKGQVVPYRDSKLTRLLQNALGGSSKTIMICALSPASSNYEETLSTLRYADRAKKIKNAAVVNEDPTQALIRSLKEENAKLKAMLEGKMPMQGVDGAPAAAMSEEEKQRIKEEHEREIKEMESRLAEMSKSWEVKLKEAQEEAAKKERETPKGPDFTTVCHLTNLNEDGQLTGKLNYSLDGQRTSIGKKDESNMPNVLLPGLGMTVGHCEILRESATELYLQVHNGVDATFLNGNKVPKEMKVKLSHGDRVVFGANYQFVFLVIVPSLTPSKDELLNTKSFEDAQKEVAEKQGELQGTSKKKSEAEEALEKAKRDEYERKMKEAEAEKIRAEEKTKAALLEKENEFKQKMMEMEKRLNDQEKARMQAEFEKQQREAEEKAKLALVELEKKKQEMEKQEMERTAKEKESKMLDEKLVKILPLVKEANTIAKELGKPYSLTTKLAVHVTHQKKRKTEVLISVSYESSHVYDWHPDVLENRVFIMRDLYEKFSEYHTPQERAQFILSLPQDQDPYWDPVQSERMIGKAQLYLNSLTCQLENEVAAKIINEEGKACGTLSVGVFPVAKDGGVIPDEDLVDDPKMLLGTRMDILVKVTKATGLPPNLANDPRVSFRFYLNDEAYGVPPAEGNKSDPVFNFERHITQDPVTQKFLDYLNSDTLVFEVYGKDKGAEIVGAIRATRSNGGSQAPSQVGTAVHSTWQSYHHSEAPTPKPLSPQGGGGGSLAASGIAPSSIGGSLAQSEVEHGKSLAPPSAAPASSKSDTKTVNLTKSEMTDTKSVPLTTPSIQPTPPPAPKPAPLPEHPTVIYSGIAAEYTVGEVLDLKPTLMGGKPDSMSIQPPLPAGLGLTFDANTGAVSGTLLMSLNSTPFIVNAKNAGGNGSAAFILCVKEKPAPAPAPVVVTPAPAPTPAPQQTPVQQPQQGGGGGGGGAASVPAAQGASQPQPPSKKPEEPKKKSGMCVVM